MKAYLVTEINENIGGVVFAKSPVEARRIGASLYNDFEFAGLSVKRREDFDKYEESGVPARLLIEEGWWFECWNCDNTINENYLEDEELFIDDVIGVVSGQVFCHRGCQKEFEILKKRIKKTEKDIINKIKKQVIKNFGNISIDKTHVYVREIQGEIIVQQCDVYFSFPEMKFGTAGFKYRPYDSQRDFVGPVQPEVWVYTGDLETFKKWRERR